VKKPFGPQQRIFLATAIIAVWVGLSAQSTMAATVYVGTCVANVTPYATIQAAVNAAKPGSTISACPGNYPEQVVINKDLTLTGYQPAGAQKTVLVIPPGGFVANATGLTSSRAIAAQILVQSPATEVTISFLAVDGTGSNLNGGCFEPPLIGIYYQGASGTIEDVVARNQAQDLANFGCGGSAAVGIFVESGNSEQAAVAILNSTVRGFQKSGIVANEAGTTVRINGNSVVGAGPSIGAVPTPIAQNGIQIAFGATGTIENNILADDDFGGDPSLGTATGILVYASGSLKIIGNSITNTQTGIVTLTAGNLKADGNTLTNNQVTDTHVGDGIDLCSNSNIVFANSVFSSDEAGIHLDGECGSTGNSNTVTLNTVNEACAAILLGGSENIISATNTFANVANTTLAGDVCPRVTQKSRLMG